MEKFSFRRLYLLGGYYSTLFALSQWLLLFCCVYAKIYILSSIGFGNVTLGVAHMSGAEFILFFYALPLVALEVLALYITAHAHPRYRKAELKRAFGLFSILFSLAAVPLVATGGAPSLAEVLPIIGAVVNVTAWLFMDNQAYKQRLASNRGPRHRHTRTRTRTYVECSPGGVN